MECLIELVSWIAAIAFRLWPHKTIIDVGSSSTSQSLTHILFSLLM